MEITKEQHIPVYKKDFYEFWLKAGISQSFIREACEEPSIIINADYMRGYEKCQETVFKLNDELREARIEIAALKNLNRQIVQLQNHLSSHPIYNNNP